MQTESLVKDVYGFIEEVVGGTIPGESNLFAETDTTCPIPTITFYRDKEISNRFLEHFSKEFNSPIAVTSYSRKENGTKLYKSAISSDADPHFLSIFSTIRSVLLFSEIGNSKLTIPSNNDGPYMLIIGSNGGKGGFLLSNYIEDVYLSLNDYHDLGEFSGGSLKDFLRAKTDYS